MKIAHRQNYADLRRRSYPRIEDQLDALWKFLADTPGKKPAEVQAMLDTITAIKTRYPKK